MLILDRYFKPQIKFKIIFFIFMSIFFLFFMDHFNRNGGYYALPKNSSIYNIDWSVINLISGLFYGSLILLYVDKKFANDGIISKAFAFGGTISYSIYLNHFFAIYVINFVRSSFLGEANLSITQAFLLYGCVALLLTLVLSTATFFIIEKPFLKMRIPYVK